MMSDETQTADAPAEPSGEQTPEQQPGETKAEAARRWKLQVDGGEEEVDDAGMLAALLDAHGEDGLRNIAQLSKATRRKMGELSHREKQLREAAEDLKDPRRALALFTKIHGRKAREVFEDWYAEQLEEQQLSPEERERRMLKSELEQLRAEREKEKKEREDRERTVQTQRAQQQIGKAFAQSLAKVGMDATPHAMARMAALAEAQLADGVPLDPDELAREVAQDYEQGEIGGLIKKLAQNPEKLVKLIGEEGVRALRAYDVSRVKSKQATPVQAAPATRREPQERKRISIDEYEAELAKRRG